VCLGATGIEGTWVNKGGTLFHVSPQIPASVGDRCNPKLTGAHVVLRRPAKGNWMYDNVVATLGRTGVTMQVQSKGNQPKTWKLIAPWGAANAKPAPRSNTPSMAGVWRPANGGATLQIPAGDKAEFDVVLTSPDGRTTSRLRGQWTINLVGTQLQFAYGKQTVIATWSARNANFLQVRADCGPSVTYRRQ